MFPIKNDLKQGDVLSPLLFNFALEYAIRRVQGNQNGLKLNGTHQRLVYVDDVNILGGSVHTVKENEEALIVASKETGLEVNAGKINPLNPELNPICYLLALLGAHHFLHVSMIRVKLLTRRRLMSYIYGAPILDVSRSHTTTQHSR